MIKNSQKRERRLHRKLNDSTHLADYKRFVVATPNEIAFKEILSLTWWQKILQWLRKLKPLA